MNEPIKALLARLLAHGYRDERGCFYCLTDIAPSWAPLGPNGERLQGGNFVDDPDIDKHAPDCTWRQIVDLAGKLGVEA